MNELSDVRHAANYRRKAHATSMNDSVIREVEGVFNQSTGLQELGSRPVHLMMKEDEQRLSFMKKGSGIHASASDVQDYQARGSQPTRGATNGMLSHGYASQMTGHDVRASANSKNMRSDPFRSNMNNYASTGANSGMARRQDPASLTGQKYSNLYTNPHASGLNVVDGQPPQLKQNFMHLRNKQNRSGVYSLDRNAAAQRHSFLPQAGHSTSKREGRLQYNSSSIPYLAKRGLTGATH